MRGYTGFGWQPYSDRRSSHAPNYHEKVQPILIHSLVLCCFPIHTHLYGLPTENKIMLDIVIKLDK
jgi:hypothetical protein